MPQIRSLALLALLAVGLAACAAGLSPSADRRAHGDMSDKDGAAIANALRGVK